MQQIKNFLILLALGMSVTNASGQHQANPYHIRTARNAGLIGLDSGSYLLTNTRFSKFFTDQNQLINDVQYVKRLKRLPGAFGIHLNQINFFGHEWLSDASISTLNLTYNHILRESEFFTWTAGLSFSQKMTVHSDPNQSEKNTHLRANLPKINTAVRFKNFYAGLSLGFIGGSFDQQSFNFHSQYDLTVGYDFELGQNFAFNLMAQHSNLFNFWERTNSLSLRTTYKNKVWLAGSYSGYNSYGISAGYLFKNGFDVGVGYTYSGYLPQINRSSIGLQLKWNF